MSYRELVSRFMYQSTVFLTRPAPTAPKCWTNKYSITSVWKLVFIFSSLFSSPAFPEKNEKYIVYSDSISGEYYKFVENESGLTSIYKNDDQLYEVESCSSDKYILCFSSFGLTLKLPKSIQDYESNTHKIDEVGIEFVAKYPFIKILGRKIDDVLLIKTDHNLTKYGRFTGSDTYWLYSSKLGIVGFGNGELGRSTSYLLEGKIGMGAKK